MRTHLPHRIDTLQEAKEFLHDLKSNGELYNPDDNAHTVLWKGTTVSYAEAEQLNKLMKDIFNIRIDPHQIILDEENGLPDFPNGFASWANTHFLVVENMLNCSKKGYITQYRNDTGMTGLWELGISMTNYFERLHEGREWDGEFIDEVDIFVRNFDKTGTYYMNANEKPERQPISTIELHMSLADARKCSDHIILSSVQTEQEVRRPEEGEEPQFWSLYGIPEGDDVPMCIADCKSKIELEQFLHELISD